MLKIAEIKQEIQKSLRPLNPVSVILFGSYATQTQNKESDLDLYIVTDDETVPKSYHEKRELHRKYAKALWNLKRLIAIDLIVHTKKMHQQFLELNSSFAKEIQNGIKIV